MSTYRVQQLSYDFVAQHDSFVVRVGDTIVELNKAKCLTLQTTTSCDPVDENIWYISTFKLAVFDAYIIFPIIVVFDFKGQLKLG